MTQFTLETVAELMALVGNGAKGTHMLIVIDGCLSLTHKTHAAPGENLITRISANEIRNGCTSSRWNAIDAALKEYNAKHAG